MKKINALLALVVLAFGGSALAFETIEVSANQVQELNSALVQQSLLTVTPLDLIDWKVGDNASYNIMAGAFGNLGTMVKSVASEEGAAIWVKQEISMMGQKEVVEMLLNRADGKILKYRHNGKDQAIPDSDIEVISQDYTEVTVPAGKFKALHIVAKMKDGKEVELWANPRDTVMDGALRTIVDTGMIGKMDIQLTKFSKK